MEALKIVQKFFPNVTRVKDAKEPLMVEVLKRDTESAKVKNHSACAMAVACKRVLKADGVIVSVTTCYVVHGTSAMRYKLPESVSREVVSFDREAGFAAGSYTIHPSNPSHKLGHGHEGSKANTGKGKKQVWKHHTLGIRTVLGSKLQ